MPRYMVTLRRTGGPRLVTSVVVDAADPAEARANAAGFAELRRGGVFEARACRRAPVGTPLDDLV